MKKMIRFLVLTLVAGFVLSSCNSSLSVTKRRYNKGYYVEHNSRRHHIKKQNTETVKHGQSVSNEASEFRAVEYVKAPEKSETTAAKKDILTASAQDAQKLTKEEKKQLRAQAVELAVKQPVKAFKRVGELSKDATGDKALSILWVVIVVILVVYLLGLLLEWGGGSGAIHILALIALVLLILWLLRII